MGQQRNRDQGNRREELARGALEVLGEHGSRGFTHRAVDRHLGLPEGTTSAYFRRREDLVAMVIRHVFAGDAQQMDKVANQIEAECGVHPTVEAVAKCCFSMWQFVVEQAQGTNVLARYECFLLARRDPELMQLVENVMLARQTRWEPIFEKLGSRDPAGSARHLGLLLRSLFFSEIFFPATITRCTSPIDLPFFVGEVRRIAFPQH
jgi:DNA-binding transcriptional regulator YbjK